MKQKDITLVIVVSFISAVVSLLLSNWLISSPKNRQAQVEVVEKLTAEFPQPDSKYFNSNSVNPTKLIQIGEDNNPSPFNSQQ